MKGSRFLAAGRVAGIILAVLWFGGCNHHSSSSSDDSDAERPPNVVLVLMDDMGIDQWQLFGYGGLTPPSMPNIRSVAEAGVQFHNYWSMPACSNGRAALFTGRYPLRTHVMTAIGNNDLANYMINPNETTLPRLLHTRGYKSALFGKFHLGIQANNPYGLRMVHALGFDYYEGWLDETGDPSSIDTTAGGVAPEGTYSCGFVPDASQPGGANRGACYRADNSCQYMVKTGVEAPGRICRDQGGIFDPRNQCAAPTPDYIKFTNLSGYYVSPVTINREDGTEVSLPLTDSRARTYRTTEVVNAALDWIDQQPADQPWMVTLSFAADHTPFMQPPSDLLPNAAPYSSSLDCSNVMHQQLISNQMEEALDHEVGRFLISAGLATRDNSGELIYDPAESNTYVIVVSDNGSLGTVAKAPFDKSRSKSTAYQTGVWNPAIVAGPEVYAPGRSVDAMVNVVDIFQLVGNLAGIDNVHEVVPRTLDSQPMLNYLTYPELPDVRTTSYTEVGYNRHAGGKLNGPCVFNITTPSCSQITPSAGVCHDNGGTWWGPNPDEAGAPPEGLPKCCNVAMWQHEHNQDQDPVTDMFPELAYAVRNSNYKLVVNQYDAFDDSATTTGGCVKTTSTEFYEIDEAVPTPKLDKEGEELFKSDQAPSDIPEADLKARLTDEQLQNYLALSQRLDEIRSSEANCPADVNLDGVVDEQDIAEWEKFAALSEGKSSWADVDQDGLTDDGDKQLIQDAFGNCPSS